VAIEFSCEHCGKALSTSDDKAGWKARCPQCGEIIQVPAVTMEQVPAVAMDSAATDTPATPPARMVREKHCRSCGERIPVSDRRCSFCGEEQSSAAETSRRTHWRIDPGDVMATAWDAFGKQLGLLVGANLLTTLLTLMSLAPAFVVIAIGAAAAEQQDPDLSLLLLLFLPASFLPFAAVQCFLMPGLTRLYLGVSRGDKVSLGTVFAGGRYFFRTLLSTVVFVLAVGLGLLMCLIPGIFVALRLWPYLYLLVDEDLPALESLKRAADITRDNMGTSLILGLVSFGINVAAQLVCGILQLFTLPLSALFFSTAYVKMTGQDQLA
jgi:phage FluMu protein Com